MDAYVDGSYYSGLQRYAVAALVAPPNDWVRLEIRWRRLLREADPQLEVFHMTDFMSRKVPPYCDWSEAKRDKLLDNLSRAMRTTISYGCAGILMHEGYETMMRLYAELSARGQPNMGDNPYEICADSCVGLLSEHLDSVGPDWRVAYFLESGDEGQGSYLASVHRILEKSRHYRNLFKVQSMAVVAKKDAFALQTADILAYELTHCRAEMGASEYTKTLSRLGGMIPISVYHIGPAQMEALTTGYTPEVITAAIKDHSLNITPQKKRRRRNA